MYREYMTPAATKVWTAALRGLYEDGRLSEAEHNVLKAFLVETLKAWEEGRTAQERFADHPEIVKYFAKEFDLKIVIDKPRRPEKPNTALVRQPGSHGNSPAAAKAAGHPKPSSSRMPDRKPGPNAKPTGSKERPHVPDKAGQTRSTSTSAPSRPLPTSTNGPISTARAGVHYGKGALPPRTTVPRPEAAPWAPKSKPPEWMKYAQFFEPAGQPEPHGQGDLRGHHGKPRLPGNANRPGPAATNMTGQRRAQNPLPQQNIPRAKITITSRLMRGAMQGLKWWKR